MDSSPQNAELLAARDSLPGPWTATQLAQVIFDNTRRAERERVLLLVAKAGLAALVTLGGAVFAVVHWLFPTPQIGSPAPAEIPCTYQVPRGTTIADLATISGHAARDVIADNLPLVCLASNGNFFFREGEVIRLHMPVCPIQAVRQITMPQCRRRGGP